MANRLKSFLTGLLTIRPEDEVPHNVAKNFRHNVTMGSLDLMFFIFGDGFGSITTIMPVFAATLTKSPLLIGLIPAIANFGWYMPQMFLSNYVSGLKQKHPFAVKMAVVERVPYVFFPLLALLVPSIPKTTALLWLFILITWRGLASGLIALPWQEVQASVIPITHRARFYGVSRVLAQFMGILSSVLATIFLSRLPYPQNYALCFATAVVAQWFSFYFYSRIREPVNTELETASADPASSAGARMEQEKTKPARKIIDLELFGAILKRDKNFRYYLVGRSVIFLGAMASGFLAVYGIQRFNLSDSRAAVFTALLYFSGIIGYTLGGMLGDKVGPKRIVVASVLIWAVGMLIAILARSEWAYYLVFLMFGLNSAGMVLGDSILVMELGEEKLRPTYLGMARSLTGIFVLVAPVFAGALVEAFGYNVMFTVCLALTLLGAAIISRVKDLPRRASRLKSEQTSV
ncbi:MAG TPA: MFS transporter [Anaerolineaceae bacterium]|nr:MFS transporter [Anaerolineaceae bacterium]